MALSNKFGALLLTTGNKSELAVGYCTLYGDMCGGLAVISDVPKTLVYGSRGSSIASARSFPEDVVHKPPTAELRPNQNDQDTLPPLRRARSPSSRRTSSRELDARGHRRASVRSAASSATCSGGSTRSEYKRRQAAPGLKITSQGVRRRPPLSAGRATRGPARAGALVAGRGPCCRHPSSKSRICPSRSAARPCCATSRSASRRAPPSP